MFHIRCTINSFFKQKLAVHMADREDLHVSNLCDTANVHTTVDEDYYLNVKNIF